MDTPGSDHASNHRRGLRRNSALLTMPFLLCGLGSPGHAQDRPAAAPTTATVRLEGNTLTLSNAFGLAFAEQPIEARLANPAPAGLTLVIDEDGKTVGQVGSDRRRVFLRLGFAEGQGERRLTLAAGAATAPAGLTHPVRLREATWTVAQAGAAGTTHPNGIASYYEISNGLCGVRVPASVRDGTLPGTAVPAPIVGVRHADGEWAGRPDFRALVVPARGSSNGNIPREGWKFTGFESEVVERGAVRTTVRLTVGTDNREEPYRYEVTLYAGERFVKFRQLSGRINDWFLDLGLDKETPWRPTRWRSGAQHHFPANTAELPDRPGRKYTLAWDKGPGPTTRHPEQFGEGEGDLFSHDLWVEFTGADWGGTMLLNKVGDPDLSHSRWGVGVRGIPLWYPWAGVGSEIYALDPKGGVASPVAGLIQGPASEIEGWEARDDPTGEAGFCQHIPAQLDSDPAVYDSMITHKYMLNDRYQGVADRDRPVFGIRFAMNARSGSYFLWLGDNGAIVPDIADPRLAATLPGYHELTPDDFKTSSQGYLYRSPLWQDYARFTGGVANLQDALAWAVDWDDPANASYPMEPDVVRRNIERIRKGEDLGNYDLMKLWKLTTDAERVAATDDFIGRMLDQPIVGIRPRVRFAQATHWNHDPEAFQWYTYDRYVAGRLDELSAYFALGRKSEGGLLSEKQWRSLKRIGAFLFQTTFDEDRAMFWNPGTSLNHGGGTMTSQGNLARLGIILNFPTWPDSRRYADRPVAEQERALREEFGRWGAQFTSTHYSSLGAITQPLAGLLALQWRSYKQPETYPDKFKDDPRLRHYAFFVLNRTGVKDPRYGNIRVPIAVGNGGAGWGHPAAALLSSGFRHIDPQLSRWLMWAWVANGKSTRMTPLLPTMFDYGTPAEPYPFPAVSTFPGNMTIHRSAPHSPHETGVWITDGGFFGQHREPAESGEVHIDALGKPLVTSGVSYSDPFLENEFYKNVIGTETTNWDTNDFYWGRQHNPWLVSKDAVTAIGSFPDGSYSSSRFAADEAGSHTWSRQVAVVRPDADLPVIYIRDTMSQPREYISTFWLQTEGAVTTPEGRQVTPPVKIFPFNVNRAPDKPEEMPSAIKVPCPQGPGGATFGFSGHDWLKLYPKSYAESGINDVGPLVDVEVHAINAAQMEAVVGHWRVNNGSSLFSGPDSRIDDRQYLRVKFAGKEHITVFTPFLRGKRPADLNVVRDADGAVRVSYTTPGAAGRIIVITPRGYRIETDGRVTGRAAFPDELPARLYPQWKDVDYHGP